MDQVIKLIKGFLFSQVIEWTWFTQQGLTQGNAQECRAWTKNNLSICILLLGELQEDIKPKDKLAIYFIPLSGENLRSDSEQNEKKCMLISLLLREKGGKQKEAG